ncbi:hypothetical protein B0H14DRAFT_2636466 [Mycena olivaceomarginata]|nr:hypothetical protein B0H14DRAFT_2636466 [Mycena olivaceomarginata]
MTGKTPSSSLKRIRVFREKLGSKDVVVVSNWSAQTRTSEADIIKQYKPILPLNVAIPGFSTTYRGSSQESEANPHQALRIVVHDEFYLITSLELATAAELREAFQGIFNCASLYKKCSSSQQRMRTPKEQINGEQHGQHSDRVALTSDRGGAGSSFLLKCKCGAVSHGGSESGNDEDSEFELHVVGGYDCFTNVFDGGSPIILVSQESSATSIAGRDS